MKDNVIGCGGGSSWVWSSRILAHKDAEIAYDPANRVKTVRMFEL